MIKQESSLLVDTVNICATFCVYEHLFIPENGDAPILIFVGFDKLTDVYSLKHARNNSEWMKMYGFGGKIAIRIIWTSMDYKAIMKKAYEHLRGFSPLPICNLRGIDMRAIRRKIYCPDNNTTYQSQIEAARTLGLDQGRISQHLRSANPRPIRGYSFQYA